MTTDNSGGGGGKKANTASGFRVQSINYNSIGRNPKRRVFFEKMTRYSPDILFVIDTRLDPALEDIVKAEWGAKCYFSSFASNARGIAMFIKKNFSIKILKVHKDVKGNTLGILANVQDKKILFQGVYGPNSDDPSFYENELFQQYADWTPDFSIYCGDWNITMDPKKDTKNYSRIGKQNPKAREQLIKKIDEIGLIDIYRDQNPDGEQYTWKKWSEDKMARLDYFLISANLAPFVHRVGFAPISKTDHKIITLEIDFQRFQQGKGFWKFNNSLLKEPEFVDTVNQKIRATLKQYAILDTNRPAENALFETLDKTEIQSLPSILNPHLLLDNLLQEVRGTTIKYAARRKKNRKTRENLLLLKQEEIDKKIQLNSDPAIYKSLSAELGEVQLELEAFYEHKARGAMVRARAKMGVEGEKPTAAWLGMESYKACQKFIPKIIKPQPGGGEIILTTQKDIEAECPNFYEDLFRYRVHEDENRPIEDFLGGSEDVPKLSNTEKNSIEQDITLKELSEYLMSSKNNVAPGSSGYTNEFYKFFWPSLGTLIKKYADYCPKREKMSIVQRLGVLNLLPKGEKKQEFSSKLEANHIIKYNIQNHKWHNSK